MSLGFCASKDNAPKPEKEVPDTECLLKFDSGQSLSFEDGLHHLLCLGTTGSGKTMSLMAPALRSHIAAGHGGLVIDIKGSLFKWIRAIAAEAGRLSDIVEYGTFPSAVKTNICSNMDASDFYDFCVGLLKDNFDNSSNNMDFHVKSAGVARDCLELMRLLNRHAPKNCRDNFIPNLRVIAEMFQNHRRATALFAYFAEELAARENLEHRQFVDRVQSTRFHVLTQDDDAYGATHLEQLAYVTDYLKNAFKVFLDAPGVLQNFNAHTSRGVDLEEAFRDNRLVVLRFGPGAGKVGAHIARKLVNDYYDLIYRHGMENLETMKFVCIDEFQDIADLSHGRFSDRNFIGMAREFRAGFLAATQSASSLLAPSVRPEAVESFISNCNCKVFFFSDDILTRDLAKRYEPNLDLIDLAPGEAFAVKYDSISRKHFWGKETLSAGFNSLLNLDVPAEPEAQAPLPAPPTLSELMDSLAITLEDQKNPRVKKRKLFVKMEKDTAQKPKINVKISSPHIVIGGLQSKYPALFTPDARINVPRGWLELAEKTLEFFASLKLDVKISELGIEGNCVLRASGTDSHGIRVLNGFLLQSENICMHCGAVLPERDEEEFGALPSERVCETCLEKFGLKKYIREKK